VQIAVFAPNDQAFTDLATKLGFDSATAMVEALPATTLKSILEFHLLETPKTGTEIVNGPRVQPTQFVASGNRTALAINNTSFRGVTITDGALRTANVLAVDVKASNGVIHPVDSVLVPPSLLDIVQMAKLYPGLNSLLTAATRAELVGTLTDPAAQLTVFAPTDAAFTKLTTSLGSEASPVALADLPVDTLRKVLSYHVLPSKKLAADLVTGNLPSAYFLNTTTPANLAVTVNNGVKIKDAFGLDATVTVTDIVASNGVIHVINSVLNPVSVYSVIQTLKINPNLSSFLQVLKDINAVDGLEARSATMIFAPTNDAFQAGPQNLTTTQKEKIVGYHTSPQIRSVAGLTPVAPPATLSTQRAIPTFAGQNVNLGIRIPLVAGGPTRIFDQQTRQGTIVTGDIVCINGVVHIIDRVMLVNGF
jgi:uncharacterized surface protein with fasciclin (FAS1) repeats